MDTNKQVLIINTIGLNFEGITSVISNYAGAMDRSGMHLNFLAYPETDPRLLEKFSRMGTVHTVPNRKKSVKAYIKALFKILKAGFHTVHIHGNSGTMLIETLLARLMGARIVIVHAHNTTCNHPLINGLLKLPMKWLATDLMACSQAAGQWLYGKSRFTVLNNAIDVPNCKFDPVANENLRQELGLEGAFVVGHCGHFTQQKNHDFLIDVFAQIHSRAPEAKLLLISDGPNFEKIRQKVHGASLTDAVVFAGRRSDVNKLYSCMDVFVMPSLWEGLPLVMLEAQANGLPLLVSDCITQDAKCTDRTFYKALSDGPESWADTVLQIQQSHYDRSWDGVYKALSDHGFDIFAEANKLRNIYMGEH